MQESYILSFMHYSLLRILRTERRRMLSLRELGLSPSQSVDVISWAPPRTNTAPEAALEGYFDASDRLEGGDVIIWFNNIEKDSRYAQWPSSLTGVSDAAKSTL